MDTPESPWSEGRFDGREAFRQSLRDALAHVRLHQLPWMFWSDPDFEDWPLEERDFVEQLQAWALQGGRLRMLASDFRGVQRRAARFVVWRKQWDPRFEARASGRARVAETPGVLLTPDRMLWRLVPERQVFVVTADRPQRTQISDQLESLWQQSVAAFPATTLGL